MREIDISADDLVLNLLRFSEKEPVCILDSCGVGHLGSHRLIAGVFPNESIEISADKPSESLELLEDKLTDSNAAFFTIGYEFGLKLENISNRNPKNNNLEPDIFLSTFENLIIHDYDSGKTHIEGKAENFDSIAKTITHKQKTYSDTKFPRTNLRSNFTKSEYITAVENIQELIRAGETYQTNLTQQLVGKN